MIKQKYVKSRNVTKVTFQLPVMHFPEGVDVDSIQSVSVVGDFNGWDPDANPLKHNKKRKQYEATVELDPNQAYEFRYLLDGEHFFNDWEADQYVSNGHGEDNSVVRTQNGQA